MFITMNKPWVLFLFVKFACCQLYIQNKIAECDDCIPIAMCKEASDCMEMTGPNLQYISQFFCGVTSTFNVCCSKMKETKHPNLKLLPDTCGHDHGYPSLRIAGGSSSKLYEFPWMVVIAYSTTKGTEYLCSGTLISSRYVLTAAHCVLSMDILYVRVGEYEIGKDIDCDDDNCESHIQDVKVEEEILHEKYNKYEHFANDIALLRLAENVNMTFDNTKTICLPLTRKLRLKSITDRRAIVAGWGYTEYGNKSNVLLHAVIPVRSNEECQSHYSYLSNPDMNKICAGIINKDSCSGDSGGPLMLRYTYRRREQYIQYGIVSSGPSECGAENPGIYTDVRKYVNWILDNIK